MFYVGVDLGQRKDFSAIAVVERREARGFEPVYWRTETAQSNQLVVRYLERMRLGTPYTDVVRRVVEVAEHHLLAGPRRLIVDATGVGMPVVDMLRASRPGCEVAPVLITGGTMERYDRGMWHVPRVDLIAGMQGMLERGELKIARMKETGALVRELVGAVGGKGHDDLVFAVALACWWAGKTSVGERGRRLI